MRFGIPASAVIGMAVFAGAAIAAPGTAYVADEGIDTVSVLDGASFKRVATIAVGRSPHNVQVSPDGRFAWVTNEGGSRKTEEHGSASGDEHGKGGERGELWAIDRGTRTIVAQVPVGRHPARVVLTTDGRFAYVTNGGDSTVSIVDTEARKVVATVPVGAYPHCLRISPDGTQAYVANMKGVPVGREPNGISVAP